MARSRFENYAMMALYLCEFSVGFSRSLYVARLSLTKALRTLTYFSNYAATVAELKERAKELSPINLDAGRVRATALSDGALVACACRGWRE